MHPRNRQQFFYQLLRMRQLPGIDYYAHHNLICLGAHPNQNMSHHSRMAFLVIRFYVPSFHKCLNLPHNLSVHILPGSTVHAQCTRLHLHNGMGSSGIKSTDNFSVPVHSYRKLRLISIMKRTILLFSCDTQFLHAHDWFHLKIRNSANSSNIIVYFILFEP